MINQTSLFGDSISKLTNKSKNNFHTKNTLSPNNKLSKNIVQQNSKAKTNFPLLSNHSKYAPPKHNKNNKKVDKPLNQQQEQERKQFLKKLQSLQINHPQNKQNQIVETCIGPQVLPLIMNKSRSRVIHQVSEQKNENTSDCKCSKKYCNFCSKDGISRKKKVSILRNNFPKKKEQSFQRTPSISEHSFSHHFVSSRIIPNSYSNLKFQTPFQENKSRYIYFQSNVMINLKKFEKQNDSRQSHLRPVSYIDFGEFSLNQDQFSESEAQFLNMEIQNKFNTLQKALWITQGKIVCLDPIMKYSKKTFRNNIQSVYVVDLWNDNDNPEAFNGFMKVYGYTTSPINKVSYLIVQQNVDNSLKNLVKQFNCLTQIHTLKIIRRLAQSLKILHSKKIIHGNIRPETIYYDIDGNTIIGLSSECLSIKLKKDKLALRKNSSISDIDSCYETQSQPQEEKQYSYFDAPEKIIKDNVSSNTIQSGQLKADPWGIGCLALYLMLGDISYDKQIHPYNVFQQQQLGPFYIDTKSPFTNITACKFKKQTQLLEPKKQIYQQQRNKFIQNIAKIKSTLTKSGLYRKNLKKQKKSIPSFDISVNLINLIRNCLILIQENRFSIKQILEHQSLSEI